MQKASNSNNPALKFKIFFHNIFTGHLFSISSQTKGRTNVPITAKIAQVLVHQRLT